MNTFQLTCFLAVAETLSFARAAEQLHVTQPAVTQQIKSLEKELNVKLFRLLIILLSSLLSACVVAFAGPVSFVGIAVPHLTKLLFNSSKPAVVLPGTFLLGAVFCLVCDLIARTIFAPTELAIGTVTAIFGAPVVIAMLLKSRRKSV